MLSLGILSMELLMKRNRSSSNTLLKCAVQWCLVYSQECATITTISFQTIFITCKCFFDPFFPDSSFGWWMSFSSPFCFAPVATVTTSFGFAWDLPGFKTENPTSQNILGPGKPGAVVHHQCWGRKHHQRPARVPHHSGVYQLPSLCQFLHLFV